MQGSVDNDKSIRANFNWRWASNLVTKTSLQLGSGPGQEVLSIDNEYTGRDFTASLKAINPSPLDNALVGMYMAGYLQSITPSLALGFEALWQRQALTMGPETAFSYCAKYTGLDWIASARLASQGMVTASYWRKLTEKVEVGADVQLQFAGLSGAAAMMGGPKNDGIATMGARYDFRMSSFKAQLDSTGKLSCLLEKRIAPPVSVTFAADMDHSKVFEPSY